MSLCAFNSFPNGGYSNVFIVAAFSSKYFSGRTCHSNFPSQKFTCTNSKIQIHKY